MELSFSTLMVLFGAAVFGALMAFGIAFVARWLPQQMEKDWRAQCVEGLAEDPMPKVVIGRIEKVVITIVAAFLCQLSIIIYGDGIRGCVAIGFCMTLLLLAVIDIHTYLLPDDINLSLMWAGLLISISGVFVSPQDALIGAAAGYLSLWSIYWLFKLATGREGMGFGDFKLLAAIGAFTGWMSLPMIALIAAVFGVVYALVNRFRKAQTTSQPIPFGPYLALGGLVVFFANGASIPLMKMMSGVH